MLRRKWPTASKVYLALAVASGLGAFLLSRGYAQRLEAEHPAIGPAVPVVVASVDVARGSTIAASQLDVRQIPSSFAPPGAFGDASSVAGRVATGDVAAGEPLTRTRVSRPGSGPVAALVPQSLRAFTITTALPPGEVRAGDRVDVLATYGEGHPHTETAAEGLEVLVASRSSSAASSLGPQAASDEGSSLVVLVSPDAAEGLAYAQAFGTLSIAVEPPLPAG
jgi:pilus assembly protein CpaB